MSVFDRLAELVDWADIMEPLGWSCVRPPDASTLEAWRRPGGTHPVSAKVLKDAPYVLVNWSEDSGLPSGAGQKLTKARVLAHFHYGGDESAFAKDLVRGAAKGCRRTSTRLAVRPAGQTGGVTEVAAETLNGDSQDADEAVKEKFPRLDWHALWADQTEQEYIHNPLLPARRLVAIYSAPKIGNRRSCSKWLSPCPAAQNSSATHQTGATASWTSTTKTTRRRHPRPPPNGYGPDDLDHLDYLSFPTIAALNSAPRRSPTIAAVNAYRSEVVVIDTVSEPSTAKRTATTPGSSSTYTPGSN